MFHMKKCRLCPEFFEQRSMSHIFCSPKCAIKDAKNTLKVKKAKNAKVSSVVRDKSYYVKKLQQEFNKFIRIRDMNDPCISCGKHRAAYHAGHYLSIGGHSELRFEELNVHKQCVACNMHLSGNLLNYRKGLINKIGLSKVEWLESSHDINKYTIDDLIELIADYRNKYKSIN